MKTRSLSQLALLGTALAALGLSGCSREDDSRTVGQALDDTVAKVEQKTEAAGDKLAQGAAEVKSEVGQAATEAGNAVTDAAITARVNAALAMDSGLSALQIDVDTVGGRVALRGTAPDAAAREHAAQLASRVDGVRSVDNQLTVPSS